MKTVAPHETMAMRMGKYGTAVSSLGGFMCAMAVMADSAGTTVDYANAAVGLALIFGGGIGFAYGRVASYVIGCSMVVVTLALFREIRYPWQLKFVYGMITATIVYFFSPFDIVRLSIASFLSGQSIGLIADLSVIAVYVIAIYLSQIVARKYISEVSLTGRKAKIR